MNLDILRQIQPLASLSDRQLSYIHRRLSWHRYDIGDFVSPEAIPADTEALVYQGKIQVIVGHSGQYETVDHLVAGTVFNRHRLRSYATSVKLRAVEPTLLSTLPELSMQAEMLQVQTRRSLPLPALAQYKPIGRLLLASLVLLGLGLWIGQVYGRPIFANLSYGLSHYYLANDDQARAEYWLHKSIRWNPQNARAYHDLGYFDYQAGRNVSAQRFFQQALKLEPHLAVAHNNLGLIHLKQGNFDLARNKFNQATLLNPESVDAWLNLAIAEHQAGKDKAAIQAYQATLRLQPELSIALANLGSLYYEQAHWNEAEQYLKQALLHQPGLPQAEMMLGALALKQGKQEQAWYRLQRAQRAQPDDPQLHFYLSLWYVKAGQQQAAIQALKTVLTLHPSPNLDALAHSHLVVLESTDSVQYIAPYNHHHTRSYDYVTNVY